jgi:hypothetical protein
MTPELSMSKSGEAKAVPLLPKMLPLPLPLQKMLPKMLLLPPPLEATTQCTARAPTRRGALARAPPDRTGTWPASSAAK